MWCYDPRFSSLLENYISALGLRADQYTRVEVPGGALELSRENIVGLRYLETTVRKHGPRIIDLMMHQDCAACGGEDDPDYYYKRLIAARGIVQEHFSGIDDIDVEVHATYASFEGLIEVDPYHALGRADVLVSV